LVKKHGKRRETKLQKDTLNKAIAKAQIEVSQLDYIFAGDLINQCIGSAYAGRDTDVPFFGLYGACSTMAESLILAAMAVDGGFANYAAAVTSSHFCSAERQFRFPLEYGGQRTPTAQWTVTGSGAVILSSKAGPPYIIYSTPGKIIDMGITDVNNMGAAMAPAACDTIYTFLKDTNTKPSDYD
jgi:stage V sporulation protein AD